MSAEGELVFGLRIFFSYFAVLRFCGFRDFDFSIFRGANLQLTLYNLQLITPTTFFSVFCKIIVQVSVQVGVPLRRWAFKPEDIIYLMDNRAGIAFDGCGVVFLWIAYTSVGIVHPYVATYEVMFSFGGADMGCVADVVAKCDSRACVGDVDWVEQACAVVDSFGEVCLVFDFLSTNVDAIVLNVVTYEATQFFYCYLVEGINVRLLSPCT